jgi:hypothetical protein
VTLARYGLPVQSCSGAVASVVPQALSLLQVAQKFADFKKRSVQATTFRVHYEQGFLKILQTANTDIPDDIYIWVTEISAPYGCPLSFKA